VDLTRQGANILLKWNPDNNDDVEKARCAYLSFMKQGWLATMQNALHEYRRVLRFPPHVGELLFVPFSEGG
jgi:hypothetical protein